MEQTREEPSVDALGLEVSAWMKAQMESPQFCCSSRQDVTAGSLSLVLARLAVTTCLGPEEGRGIAQVGPGHRAEACSQAVPVCREHPGHP